MVLPDSSGSRGLGSAGLMSHAGLSPACSPEVQGPAGVCESPAGPSEGAEQPKPEADEALLSDQPAYGGSPAQVTHSYTPAQVTHRYTPEEVTHPRTGNTQLHTCRVNTPLHREHTGTHLPS